VEEQGQVARLVMQLKADSADEQIGVLLAACERFTEGGPGRSVEVSGSGRCPVSCPRCTRPSWRDVLSDVNLSEACGVGVEPGSKRGFWVRVGCG
jgi:hypothetical protein